MTPTLVRQHHPHRSNLPREGEGPSRARDWAEIQERMLVPLYEAVYARLDVGSGARLLELGCGSGLALLMAASRGARVSGVEQAEPERLALARGRLLPDPSSGVVGNSRAWEAGPRLFDGPPAHAADPDGTPYDLVTVFRPIGSTAGDAERLTDLLKEASPLARHGARVVLAGWGPPERCATTSVLRVAARLADPVRGAGGWRAPRRDDLEEVAERAGLRPDGSGRVACPFGYASQESAVQGLVSTGLFDAAALATDGTQVRKELTEALHPHVREDGTVWMPNVFRYLIARIP